MKDANKRFIEMMNECISMSLKGCKNQKDFCKKMKMHEPTISQIKSNAISVTVDQIKRLGEIFGISPTYIIIGVSSKYIDENKMNWKIAIAHLVSELENKK